MRPQKPTVDPRQAEAWAAERYGLTASASELPGEIDRNFLLAAEDGSHWVLKVAPGLAVSERLQSQIAALQLLAATDLAAFVPAVRADRNRRPFSEVRLEDGSVGWLRVVSYLDGRPLAGLAASPRLRTDVGRAIGRLDRALADFDHPGARRPHVWDITRVLDLAPLAPLLEADLRVPVERALAGFRSRVVLRLEDLPTSVIHNDANDHNLLVKEDAQGGWRLRGLIDFGDLVHSITVAELAVACAYAMLGASDPAAAAAEVTAGYETSRPLEALERELLDDLIAARLAASLLLAAQARSSDPDDDYLQISQAPVADLLRRLQT